MTTSSKGAALAVALVAIALGGGSASPARAVHQQLTLQLTPETSRNPQGTMHTVQATISAPSTVPQLEVHFKITMGPNAKDPVVLTEPDHTCVITAGQTQCGQPFTYQDRRSTLTNHTDTIVGWIDHDPGFGRDALSLDGLDKEEIPDAGGPPDEPGISGHAADKGEPDSTDVVLKTWGQLGASALPLIDGLHRVASLCRSSVGRSGGVVVSVVHRCAYLIALPGDREEDVKHVYYALWVQAAATVPRRGWCATAFEVTARAPSSSRIVSVVTPAVGRSARDRVLTTRMPVTAGGFAFEPGLVEQSAFYRPGVTWKGKAQGGGAQSFGWRGKIRSSLALVMGVQFAVPAGVGHPTLAGAGQAQLAVRRC
jgi:hypothetical protein